MRPLDPDTAPHLPGLPDDDGDIDIDLDPPTDTPDPPRTTPKPAHLANWRLMTLPVGPATHTDLPTRSSSGDGPAVTHTAAPPLPTDTTAAPTPAGRHVEPSPEAETVIAPAPTNPGRRAPSSPTYSAHSSDTPPARRAPSSPVQSAHSSDAPPARRAPSSPVQSAHSSDASPGRRAPSSPVQSAHSSDAPRNGQSASVESAHLLEAHAGGPAPSSAAQTAHSSDAHTDAEDPTTAATSSSAAATLACGAAPSDPALADEPGSGHRSGAERTGRTGIYFTPQHLADGDLDDLPPFDPPSSPESGWQYVTGRPRNRTRHFLVSRLSPVIALSAVILWSYMQLPGDRTRPKPDGAPTTHTADSSPEPSSASEAAQTPTEPSEEYEPEVAPPGLKLASADVMQILEDGSAMPRRMKQVLARDRVTILNLWATYCVPCKEELPAFRQLFEQQKTAWRGEVEFIPVQIDDPVDGAAARREHAAQMPPFKHFISDRNLPTGIKPALLAAGLAPTPWSLPVTIVVRCNGEIEQLFARSFKSVDDLRPVFDAVDRARRKLPACRAQPAPTTVIEPPREPPVSVLPAPRCGDITCQRDERCVEQPPTFKPACVTARGSVKWE